MKKYFIKYRPFILFLSTFFGIYLTLTFFYQMYLNQYDTKKNEVDCFTEIVAKQAAVAMVLFDNNSRAMASTNDSSVRLFYKNINTSKVVEGCNALSVIILFISFVVAFSAKWKPTILFILAGSATIHIFNVLRIALLTVLFYELPQYKNVLHGVVFPLFIYSIVFALWIVWVNKFSKYAKNQSPK